MKKSAATHGVSPSQLIDARIKELNDWRDKTLIRAAAALNRPNDI